VGHLLSVAGVVAMFLELSAVIAIEYVRPAGMSSRAATFAVDCGEGAAVFICDCKNSLMAEFRQEVSYDLTV
jgi:hypothetical protein